MRDLLRKLDEDGAMGLDMSPGDETAREAAKEIRALRSEVEGLKEELDVTQAGRDKLEAKLTALEALVGEWRAEVPLPQPDGARTRLRRGSRPARRDLEGGAMNEQRRREFYELCQQYRHAPPVPQSLVCDAYEALIAWVDRLPPPPGSGGEGGPTMHELAEGLRRDAEERKTAERLAEVLKGCWDRKGYDSAERLDRAAAQRVVAMAVALAAGVPDAPAPPKPPEASSLEALAADWQADIDKTDSKILEAMGEEVRLSPGRRQHILSTRLCLDQLREALSADKPPEASR